MTSRTIVLSSLKCSLSLIGVSLGSLTEVVTVLSCEIALSVVRRMSSDHGSESLSSSLNWSVLQGEVSDVVLVNHAENWLPLNGVSFGVLVISILSTFEFSESVVTNKLFGLLLGLAVVGTERSRDSG